MYIMVSSPNIQVNYPSTTFKFIKSVGGETSFAVLNESVLEIADNNSIIDSNKYVSLGVTGLFVSSNTDDTKAVLNQSSLILSNTDGTAKRVDLSGDKDNANLTLKDSGGTAIFNTSYVSFGNTAGTKSAEYNLDYAFIKNTTTDKRLNLSTTEISISNAADDTEYLKLTETGLTASASVFDLNVNSLSFKGFTSDAARQVIMSDAAGSPYWDNVTLFDVLNENGNALNKGITGLSSLYTNDLGVTGLATFQSLPQIVPSESFGDTGLIPTRGNELVTKGYVDSLVGQYSGGYNLFLNKSQFGPVGEPDNFDAYNLLSKSVTSAATTFVVTTLDSSPQKIATFVSEKLNVTTIPAGIWSMTLYGGINNAASTVQYNFKVKLSSNPANIIIDSGFSSDIDATPEEKPISYNVNGTLPTEVIVQLTDRLIIEIWCKAKTLNGAILNTYFEGEYYSFVQTTLNAGTSLLGSDNNWTANNTFQMPIKLEDGNNRCSVGAVSDGLKLYNTVDAKITQLNRSGLKSDEDKFDMTFNQLTFGGVTGTANQVLTTDANGVAHWQDVPSTVTLDEVLEESNDANQRSIINLSSIEFKSGQNDPVVLSQYSSGTLNLSCQDANKVLDITKNTKQFSGNYIKLAINDIEYWIQAFTELPS